jgi:methanogenic corrinoid protein MtbC1
MLIACRAMKAAMNEIRPRLAAGGFQPNARVSVISLTYQAEDLTGGLVADLLEGVGFEVTRSSLAVPEAERAEQWRIAEAAVIVLVVPTIALIRDSACFHSPARDTVEVLCRDRMKFGGKIVLVGGDSSRADAFGSDAHVDDFTDVVPVVERLTQNPASA